MDTLLYYYAASGEVADKLRAKIPELNPGLSVPRVMADRADLCPDVGEEYLIMTAESHDVSGLDKALSTIPIPTSSRTNETKTFEATEPAHGALCVNGTTYVFIGIIALNNG